MKHNPKITAILLAMFLVTQFLGLFVVNHYSSVKVIKGETVNVSAPELPFGLETPEIKEEKDYRNFLYTILIALVIAISLFFLFTKLKLRFILRGWFFIVVIIALGIFFNTITSNFISSRVINSLVVFAIALSLAYFKIFKRNILIHNFTELLIYPGIAAVFVPILNVFTMVLLLLIISFYDMWAVWHSQIMQKMAKFQINKLKIFSGFFVPYISRKTREKLRKMKKSELKKKKVKVNVAILGGGDIVFSIIAAGVMLKTLGIISSLFVITGATLGLSYLFFFSEKKKFYPAMPFITTGIIIGIILSYLIF